MEITMNVPDYKPSTGIKYKWENGFCISAKIENGTVILRANRGGLISLANHFLNLAQEAMPAGNHMHLDEFNSLEGGSVEIIIEKVL